MKGFKIAIFSGEIPPPTFINRLINGLAAQMVEILLVGHLKKKVSYAFANIKIVGYSGKISKLWIFLKYTVLLTLYKSKDKKKLDDWIAENAPNQRLAKVRFYPVLYQQPAIFHLQWVKSIGDWIWVRDFNIKLVVSLRGSHVNYTPICEPKFAKIYQEYFPQVDGFHGVSANIILEASKYKANTKNANVVYSGLNLEKFIFESNKNKTKPLQIISVGRSHWVKGYRFALDAMRVLKEMNIEFSYTIIGVEEEEELLFQRAQLDLKNEVVFEKTLPFQVVLERIKAANILLLPSLEEGIANVVLEAMALGTLVVSTNCGGMNEVIQNQENGFLVPTRNPHAMAEAIATIEALTSKEYQDIAKKARKKIEENHTEAQMIDGMLTLYKQVYEAD